MRPTKILLVEDDADIKELTVLALEAAGGFLVHACDSGRLAVHLARTLAPDLIILDWMMPGFDGGQTLEALRAEPATAVIPVVFMTAKLRAGEVERMRSLGAAEVIAKPFDPMKLPDQIREILRAQETSTSNRQHRPE
jgi:DNA-binding response OmpR family regulator